MGERILEAVGHQEIASRKAIGVNRPYLRTLRLNRVRRLRKRPKLFRHQRLLFGEDLIHRDERKLGDGVVFVPVRGQDGGVHGHGRSGE